MIADLVIDIRRIVSRTGNAYWYTWGRSPIRSGVCLHRRDCVPDVAVDDAQIFYHCNKPISMKCVEVTNDTTTWVEDQP